MYSLECYRQIIGNVAGIKKGEPVKSARLKANNHEVRERKAGRLSPSATLWAMIERERSMRQTEVYAQRGEVLFQLFRPAGCQERPLLFSATGGPQGEIVAPVFPAAMFVNPDLSGADERKEIGIRNKHFEIFRHRNRFALLAFVRGGRLIFGGGSRGREFRHRRTLAQGCTSDRNRGHGRFGHARFFAAIRSMMLVTLSCAAFRTRSV